MVSKSHNCKEWIGDIPKDWGLKKISSCYSVRKENTKDAKYKPLSISKQGVVPQLDNVVKSSKANARKKVEKGDFVINSRSGRKGACGISKYRGSCSPVNIVLKPKDNVNFDNRYMEFVFKSQPFSEEFHRKGYGFSEDLWSTNWKDMKNIYIPFPKLQEQKDIANFLEKVCAKIDDSISDNDELIIKLIEHKTSFITKTITEGLNPDEPTEESNIDWIGKIPKKWSLRKCKSLCQIKAGSTPSTKHPEWFNGDIDWFTPSDFKETYLLSNSNRKLSQQAKDANEITIVPEDSALIVCIGATAGKVGYTDKECSCNQQVYFLKSDVIQSKYLMYWFAANGKILQEGRDYSFLPILSIKDIGSCRIAFPEDKDKQKEITDSLDRYCKIIDNMIKNLKKTSDLYKEFKESIIYEYVTGKRLI